MVTLALIVVGIFDDNFPVSVHDEDVSITVLDNLKASILHTTIEPAFDEAFFYYKRRSSNMERTHGQLRTGLAD